MKIRIHNESIVNNVEGTCTSKLAKPVLCIETGKIYASEKDAARALGVSQNVISLHVNKKLKHCKGLHFCFVANIMDHVGEITSALQSNYASAQKWDELTAKQEAERKAREEMQNKLEASKARHMMLVAHAEKYSKSLEKAQRNHSMVLKQLEETSKEISELEEKLANGGSN